MERDQVIQVGRLRGIEKFEGEIENFILNTFISFKPVKRFENRSGVRVPLDAIKNPDIVEIHLTRT